MFFLLQLVVSRDFYVCIHSFGGKDSECRNWTSTSTSNSFFFENHSDMSILDLQSSDRIFIGIGKVPDLSIDLSTFESTITDLSVVITGTEINNTITFDFKVEQFDNLKSLVFTDLKIKPFTKSMIHTTSTTKQYSLTFENCEFLDGYIFESDIFKPLSGLPFGDVTVVEYRENWEGSSSVTPLLENFLFIDESIIGYPIETKTQDQYSYMLDSKRAIKDHSYNTQNSIQFYYNNLMGNLTLITDYFQNPSFIVNSPFEFPQRGFLYKAPVTSVNFSGGWNNNSHVGFDGIQVVLTTGNSLKVYTNVYDLTIPAGFRLDYGNSAALTGPFNINIESAESAVVFTAPWNVTCKTELTLNQKLSNLTIQNALLLHQDSAIVSNLMINVNEVAINYNLNYVFPGENNLFVNNIIKVLPNVKLTLDRKINFLENSASIDLVWDSTIGFPYLYISNSDISSSLPIIYLVDNETEEQIENANVTYANILGVPQKLICGTNIKELDRTGFNFKSHNPSFQEFGVWSFYWEKGNNGDNCLFVNMTELPHNPIIPIPTPTKNPAEVDQKVMIAMIVTFIFMIISAILGYFTKYLPSNRYDRAKELAAKHKKTFEKETESDQTENTKMINESDLSFHDSSFVPNLDSSDDDSQSSSSSVKSAYHEFRTKSRPFLAPPPEIQLKKLEPAKSVPKVRIKNEPNTSRVQQLRPAYSKKPLIPLPTMPVLKDLGQNKIIRKEQNDEVQTPLLDNFEGEKEIELSFDSFDTDEDTDENNDDAKIDTNKK